MSIATSLPDGPRGRALALGMMVIAVIILWLGVLAPLWDWYDDRAETLRRQTALGWRMTALIETLPALRKTVEESGGEATPSSAVLPGATDALAAAALQQKLDAMAIAAGLRIGSAEILPAQPAGEFRSIAVRITVTAPWRAMVGLLRAMAESDVPLVTDDLQVRAQPGNNRDSDLPVDAGFTVTGYRLAKADGS